MSCIPQITSVGTSTAGKEPTTQSGSGKVTSGGFGPSLNAPLAMGYLPTALSANGTKIFAEVRGQRLPLQVATMPFIPNTYKR